jgi:hypothetical protein
MPLTADQRAMLELMLQRGQSYSDLSGLLDLPEAEVRSRARGALEALGGADPDRNVGLTDWLLGQADPIGRADAARHVREHPEDRALAEALLTELRELAPEADLPKVPGAPTGGRLRRRQPAAPAAPKEAPARPRVAGDPRRTRLIAALGAGAVILIAVVLAVTGAFDSGDGDEPAASAGTDTTTTGGEDQTLAAIQLRAPQGGNGEGVAVIGQTSTDSVYLDLNIRNVPVPERGEAYLLWLLLTPDEGTVVPTPIPVDQEGSFQDRLSLPASTFEIVARTRFLDLALIDRQGLQEIISQVESQEVIFPFTGETALRGEVPTTGGGGEAAG